MHPDRFSKFLFKLKLMAAEVAEAVVFIAIVIAGAIEAVRFVISVVVR